MEILIVIAIMTVFTLLSAIFLSASKDEIALRSTIETVHDNIQISYQSILSEKLKQSSLFFSLTHPQWYEHKDIYLASERQQKGLVKNFNISSFSPISSTDAGTISFSWDTPEDGSDVHFSVYSGKKSLYQLPEGSGTVASPVSFSPINSKLTYEFFCFNPTSLLKESSIMLLYFSSENLDATDINDVYLSKIEVQDIHKNWVAANDLEVKLLSPFGQKKYYVQGTEYFAARVSFTKNQKEEVYEF